MAFTSGFFNSIDDDRVYDESFFAKFFATFIGNGVFPNQSTNLQVYSHENMSVKVMPGAGWIDGHAVFNDSEHIMNVDNADGVLNRIDRVVLRMDVAGRDIYPSIKKGTFATTPVAPNLQRDADAYELCLAEIYVASGTTQITQSNITDTRLNESLCGIVHGTVQQVDTTTVFNQYLEWFAETKKMSTEEIKLFIEDKKLAFDSWFDSIKGVLSGDVAGNLANEIQKVDKKVIEISNPLSIVKKMQDDNAIYEVVEYKRDDGTLYKKSVVSDKDEHGNYTKETVIFYAEDGVDVLKTITYLITYDDVGYVQSKVIESVV